MQPSDHNLSAGAILSPGEADEQLEAWTPDEFDHFTDLGLLRDLPRDNGRYD
jgi:hypothetical protein